MSNRNMSIHFKISRGIETILMFLRKLLTFMKMACSLHFSIRYLDTCFNKILAWFEFRQLKLKSSIQFVSITAALLYPL